MPSFPADEFVETFSIADLTGFPVTRTLPRAKCPSVPGNAEKTSCTNFPRIRFVIPGIEFCSRIAVRACESPKKPKNLAIKTKGPEA